uniref:Peptide chain release factor 1-like, mitochondrial n=1 Tax=Lygus hesperus TaxID=30085 RepID=A0A0A9Y3A0_LYGHE
MTRSRFLMNSLGRFFLPAICKRQSSSQSQLKLLSCLKENAVQNYLKRMEDNINSSPYASSNNVPHSYLSSLFTTRNELLNELDALKNLKADEKASKDLSDMIVEEETRYLEELQNVELDLLKSFAPPADDGNEVIVEITAGVGGKEAALFSKELFEMYCNYVDFKRWNNFVDESDVSELGGIRHARIYVEGHGALRHLMQESGIHRVQRVPSTERSGRIHTSTVAVAVLPQTTLIEIQVAEKDIIVETMRATGAGGQHVNKTDSAVRLTHVPSGMVVECQEDRSQIKNRQIALQKLKMRLNERAQAEHDSKIRGSRKSQIGTSARSDKVRTYNFPQDRVTDHRLSQSIHNVEGFLQGEDLLDSIIVNLINMSDEERLDTFIQSIKEYKD